MSPRRLLRALLGDLRRNLPHMLVSAIGIATGVGLAVTLVALGLRVRHVVLEEILPITQLEVTPSRLELDVWALRVGVGPELLDESAIDDLRALPGVVEVYPKMELGAPAVLSGGAGLLGQDIYTEVVADGIAADLVKDDVARQYSFEDPAAAQRPTEGWAPCRWDRDCVAPQYCSFSQVAGNEPVSPGELSAEPSSRSRGLAPGEGRCVEPVPVLVSKHLVEIFNGTVRRAHGFPAINPDAAIGLSGELTIGASMIRGSRRSNVVSTRVRLVGFSDKAIPLGLTLPLEVVQRLSTEMGASEDHRAQYHSAIIETGSAADVGAVAERVRALGLEVSDQGSLRAAALISIALGTIGLISGIIILGSAANIMHVLLMMVGERRHEIALLRAVGASAAQVRLLVVAEASLAGLVAAVIGLLGSWTLMLCLDLAIQSLAPAFPYRPDSFFLTPAWLPLGAAVFAVCFCALGAVIPARRACRLSPASVLSDR